MNNKNQCAKCNEPTKTPIGLWDGKNKNGRSTGGLMFSCNNTECPIKQEEGARQRIKLAQDENSKNNIDIHEMKKARMQAELTIRDCAQVLGVSLPKYCDYEKEREPMPKEYWSRIIDIASKKG